MLELSQKILQKVSFDKTLFKKELMKSIRWIKPSEKTVLLMWCLTNFGQHYKDEITDAFSRALN